MIIFGEQSLMPICRPPTRQFETSQYANVRISEENNTRNNTMNASIMPVFNESEIDQFWHNNVTEVNGALAVNSGSQKRPLHSIWHDGGWGGIVASETQKSVHARRVSSPYPSGRKFGQNSPTSHNVVLRPSFQRRVEDDLIP
jgi:hypothetical protein